MKFTSILPVSCIAGLALAATVDVTVGPGLSYSPNSVTASKGDVVRFHFGSGHNVVSGKFSSPCQPDGLIYSGEPNDGESFSVTINNTNPVWIYCSVPHHCESGMAMVINAPSNATISEYMKAASSVSSSNTPDKVTGGVLNAGSSSSSGSSSSMSPSSTGSSRSSSSPSASASASSTSSASQSSSSSTSGASKTLGSSVSAIGAIFVALALTL